MFRGTASLYIFGFRARENEKQSIYQKIQKVKLNEGHRKPVLGLIRKPWMTKLYCHFILECLQWKNKIHLMVSTF